MNPGGALLFLVSALPVLISGSALLAMSEKACKNRFDLASRSAHSTKRSIFGLIKVGQNKATKQSFQT